MGEYYLDIETTGLDPLKDEILTIQFQPLRGTAARGDLRILKAWEHPDGERGILHAFLQEHAFFDARWRFVPVGFNLLFELRFLFLRGKRHGLVPESARFEDVDKPLKDLHTVAVLMNRGAFKGASLEAFSAKPESGGAVIDAIADGDHARIEAYVRAEARAFLDLYAALTADLARYWEEDLRPRIQGTPGARRVPVEADAPSPPPRA